MKSFHRCKCSAGMLQAAMANPVDAILARRSGSTFSPILNGGMVKPGEAIRLTAGNMNTFGGDAEFVITDSNGQEVFRDTAARQLFGSTAWIDTVAPMIEGNYTLHVAQSVMFHVDRSTLDFVVSNAAPNPPSEPPSSTSWLGDVKWIALAVVAAIVVSQVGKLIPEKKKA